MDLLRQYSVFASTSFHVTNSCYQRCLIIKAKDEVIMVFIKPLKVISVLKY